MEGMDKSIVDFIKKAGEDQSLAERMSKTTNPEEAYAIAKENGVIVSFEEFKSTMGKMAEQAKELSEEEMQAIAGGGKNNWEATEMLIEAGIDFLTLIALAG